MEEDIRKCEEFINLSFLYGKLSFTKTQLYEYQTAIKNLLTRYKQLEEENKKMAEEYLVNNPGMVKYLKDNYIFKSKVKEKIEELDNKRRKFTSDNVNNFYLQEFTRKYTQKSDHDYGVFNTPETITYCINNELLGRVGVLEELLREE